MISNIIYDTLEYGDIPIYNIGRVNDVRSFWHFNPGYRVGDPITDPINAIFQRDIITQRHDERAAFWEERNVQGTDARRLEVGALVNTDIDATLKNIKDKILPWLEQIHDRAPDVPGTLIIPIRMRECMPALDVRTGEEGNTWLIKFGMAWVPYIQMGEPIPWDRVCPKEIVKQLILRGTPYLEEDIHPVTTNILNNNIARLDITTLRCWNIQKIRREEEAAEQRARMLLYRFLTEGQIVDFEESDFFLVKGSDYRTYRLENKSMHNVFLMSGERKIKEFCIVSTKKVPICDLLLGQKMMLENCPEQLYEQSNIWDINKFGEKKFVHKAKIQMGLFPPFSPFS